MGAGRPLQASWSDCCYVAGRFGGRVGEQLELGVRRRGGSAGPAAPAWWVWREWWVVGEGEVAVELGEGVGELVGGRGCGRRRG